MKKIVSLVVFIAALVWTWNIIHTSEAVGFETHSGIQLKLAELIGNTLTSKKPNAVDLKITRLWTETLSDNKVRAVFAYSFSEPSTDGDSLDQVIEGEAILHREPSDSVEVDKWTLQSVKTTNDIVVFNEGSTITPGDEPASPDAVDATAPAPTEAPSK